LIAAGWLAPLRGDRYLTGQLLSARLVLHEWHNVGKPIEISDGDQTTASIPWISVDRDLARADAPVDRVPGQAGSFGCLFDSDELSKVFRHESLLSGRRWPATRTTLD